MHRARTYSAILCCTLAAATCAPAWRPLTKLCDVFDVDKARSLVGDLEAQAFNNDATECSYPGAAKFHAVGLSLKDGRFGGSREDSVSTVKARQSGVYRGAVEVPGLGDASFLIDDNLIPDVVTYPYFWAQHGAVLYLTVSGSTGTRVTQAASTAFAKDIARRLDGRG